MARAESKMVMGYLPIEERHYPALLSLVASTTPAVRLLDPFAATITFSRLLIEQSPQFVPLTVAYFSRAAALMDGYRDAELDLVDCCLTALAERLNTRHICTFDRRDFMIIRPAHIPYFDLLP